MGRMGGGDLTPFPFIRMVILKQRQLNIRLMFRFSLLEGAEARLVDFIGGIRRIALAVRGIRAPSRP